MSPVEGEDDTAPHRHRLVGELAVPAGPLRSPAWRSAFERVPRHRFAPAFFQLCGDPAEGLWMPVTERTVGRQRWLELIYADQTLITRLDSRWFADEVHEPVRGTASSSSNLPSLVAQTYEALDVTRGHRVLEVGTGTGYATALLAHHLGDETVASIEVDAEVATRAAGILASNGYEPHVVFGDGLAGHPGRAPFDRITSTFAVPRIPRPWLNQTRAGGIIVTALEGSLGAALPVRLTVTGNSTAWGEFLPRAIPRTTADAMTFHSQARSGTAASPRRNGSTGVEEPDFGWEPAKNLIARYVGAGRDDDIERVLAAWREAGAPDITAFRLYVATDGRQRVFLPGTSLTWDLP